MASVPNIGDRTWEVIFFTVKTIHLDGRKEDLKEHFRNVELCLEPCTNFVWNLVTETTTQKGPTRGVNRRSFGNSSEGFGVVGIKTNCFTVSTVLKSHWRDLVDLVEGWKPVLDRYLGNVKTRTYVDDPDVYSRRTLVN